MSVESELACARREAETATARGDPGTALYALRKAAALERRLSQRPPARPVPIERPDRVDVYVRRQRRLVP